MKEVARAVIINEDGHILLGRRSMNSTSGAGQYCFVGGKLDLGEDPKDAVVREVREETDLEFTAIAYLARIDDASLSDDPWLVHYYFGKVTGIINLDLEEVDDVVYVSPETINDYEIAFGQRGVILDFFEAQKN